MRRLKLTNEEIIELYDTTNITLRELSRITGWSVKDLKKLLMGGS